MSLRRWYNYIPYCARAYIDSSSDEFKYLTIEDKLCDLGFVVTRGTYLYVEICKTLMGDGLWNYLYNNNRPLVSKNYANRSLVEKNIETENYMIIVEYLRKS